MELKITITGSQCLQQQVMARIKNKKIDEMYDVIEDIYQLEFVYQDRCYKLNTVITASISEYSNIIAKRLKKSDICIICFKEDFKKPYTLINEAMNSLTKKEKKSLAVVLACNNSEVYTGDKGYLLAKKREFNAPLVSYKNEFKDIQAVFETAIDCYLQKRKQKQPVNKNELINLHSAPPPLITLSRTRDKFLALVCLLACSSQNTETYTLWNYLTSLDLRVVIANQLFSPTKLGISQEKLQNNIYRMFAKAEVIREKKSKEEEPKKIQKRSSCTLM